MVCRSNRVSDLQPVWICGSEPVDVEWANSLASSTGSRNQTNRIGVYFDVASSDIQPSVFVPGINNLVDVCVSSGHKWVERSVKITVNAPGYFWLTFQAEGQSDSVGGLIDDIRLCKNTCPGALSDDFPWTANQLLFSDGFETPANAGATKYDRTLDTSGTNTGWPLLPPGWTTHSANQVDFFDWGYMSGAEGGQLAIELDASDDPSKSNRAISRSMILTPGYYNVRYRYFSMYNWGTYGVVACGLTNTASQISATTTATEGLGYPYDTAKIGLYVDADQNVSHPESAAVLRAVSVWKNPDGTAATKPALPITPIDSCMFSRQSTVRSVNFKITKPGFYWLTFRAEGTADNHGGSIDAVTLTALGSIRKGTAPSDAVVVPAPGRAAGTPIAMKSIEILAQ